jgi:hypothetical protein
MHYTTNFFAAIDQVNAAPVEGKFQPFVLTLDFSDTKLFASILGGFEAGSAADAGVHITPRDEKFFDIIWSDFGNFMHLPQFQSLEGADFKITATDKAHNRFASNMASQVEFDTIAGLQNTPRETALFNAWVEDARRVAEQLRYTPAEANALLNAANEALNRSFEDDLRNDGAL